jgi:phosphate transport system permease protein
MGTSSGDTSEKSSTLGYGRRRFAKGKTLGSTDLAARGEPFLWALGGSLSLGILLILGFLTFVIFNGFATFYPRPIYLLTLSDGSYLAGEPVRAETFRPRPDELQSLSPSDQKAIQESGGIVHRTLYRIGNFDLYNEDFKWISAHEIQKTEQPKDMFLIERLEWGPFIGTVKAVQIGAEIIDGNTLKNNQLYKWIDQAQSRRDHIEKIEKTEIGKINRQLENQRLKIRRANLIHGEDSLEAINTKNSLASQNQALEEQFVILRDKAQELKAQDQEFTITMHDANGREQNLRLSQIVRMVPSNDLGPIGKAKIYLSRWKEFLTEVPREANTEGGVLPAIFGTCLMTLLMAIAVAPFGIMAAVYLKEYAKQGRLVSLIRISVNNLAGVPSIVYGVFGVGFFAYTIGAGIDELFFLERLPNPTFGTGGILWAALTLALLTVPVVIVSTEEALAAVPQSMREGALACGASKWQCIKSIVLPRALPGILTGLILAMARGAGEVAPLMLVGVVKLAPDLAIDSYFPFIHLERSFMHLGFHIYDVGFQSRNSEAGKPMVFVTTLLLISLVFAMNATAIFIRNRLKRKFYIGHF